MSRPGNEKHAAEQPAVIYQNEASLLSLRVFMISLFFAELLVLHAMPASPMKPLLALLQTLILGGYVATVQAYRRE